MHDHVNVPAGYMTRSSVAEYVGRGLSTIVRWERDGLIRPDASVERGQITVHLYSIKYVNSVVAQVAVSTKAGRPRVHPISEQVYATGAGRYARKEVAA